MINKYLNLNRSKKTIEALIVSCFPSFTALKCLINNIHIPILFLWITLAVFIALIVYTLFSKIFRKKNIPQLWDEVGSCLIVSFFTLAFVSTVIGVQIKERNNLKEEVYSLILSEQKGLFLDDEENLSRGIVDYHAKDYEKAAQKLKQHLNSPVEQYYYGHMLYYGLGIQADEKKGIELIRESADKHFFRAMVFMVDWGRFSDRTDIIPYAEMMVHAFPNKISLLRFENSINKFSEEQYIYYINACIKSYSLLYNYYAFTRRSYYKVWCLINDFDIALREYNKQTDNLFYEESARANAWGLWHLESRLIGKMYMWLNATIRFPHSGYAHFEYALMLLDQPQNKDDNYENINFENTPKRNLRHAEKELDKSLRIALRKGNVPYQYRSLQLLSKILEYTDRESEANRLSILISNLKLKEYYENLDN